MGQRDVRVRGWEGIGLDQGKCKMREGAEKGKQSCNYRYPDGPPKEIRRLRRNPILRRLTDSPVHVFI